jgi:hypothetical protein
MVAFKSNSLFIENIIQYSIFIVSYMMRTRIIMVTFYFQDFQEISKYMIFIPRRRYGKTAKEGQTIFA